MTYLAFEKSIISKNELIPLNNKKMNKILFIICCKESPFIVLLCLFPPICWDIIYQVPIITGLEGGLM